MYKLVLAYEEVNFNFSSYFSLLKEANGDVGINKPLENIDSSV